MAKVIGFSVESYARFTRHLEANGGTNNFKNIVPLELMTPKQRYEIAIEDDEDTSIWDDEETFFNDLNCDFVNTDGMWFYSYND